MNEANVQGCLNLAEAIIKQAVIDYRLGDNDRKKEVERFFRSEWGALLCESHGMDPGYILKLLGQKGGR